MFDRMHQTATAQAARREAEASGLDFLAQQPVDGDVGLVEILASLSADSADPDAQIRQLEDKIRRQWATLRDLVQEHAALTRRGRAGTGDPAAMVAAPRPDRAKVKLFIPPPRRPRNAG